MKVRILNNYEIFHQPGAKTGPAVAGSNDLHFLRDEDWLEFKYTSIEDCVKDNVVPWVREAAGEAIKKCEELNWPLIIGPNTVFGCSDHPEYNERELSSPVIHRLLMLDETNAALAKSLCKYDPSKIRLVRHFMRPELYREPMVYKPEWDIYFHLKGDVNVKLRKIFPNFTATFHGFYKFDELKYKAQHSKVCVHACAYDNYGIAAHEISLLGCPIVYDENGFKPGTIGDGMGVKVTSVKGGIEELEYAVHKAMEMKRDEVWKASYMFQHPDRLLEIYREAILG